MGCSAQPKPGEIHVWFVELTAEMSAVETCFRALSAEESTRASQFRSEHLRTDFVLSHGVLRALLGRYLALSSDRVTFVRGPQGKPRVAFPETELQFNMAHSGRLAAYAVASGCELGIDIEKVRPLNDQEGIVRRFFSVEECEEWLRLGGSERDEAFFRCWTRKEALLKALGDGLSRPLDSFRVSLGLAPILMHVAGDASAAARWSLYSLSPAEGYVCTLALPERRCNVSVFQKMSVPGLLTLAAGSDVWPPGNAGG